MSDDRHASVAAPGLVIDGVRHSLTLTETEAANGTANVAGGPDVARSTAPPAPQVYLRSTTHQPHAAGAVHERCYVHSGNLLPPPFAEYVRSSKHGHSFWSR